MSIRERLDTLSRGELAGLALVVVATLAGAGLWYARSLPKPILVAETPAATAAAPSSSGAAVVASGSAEPSATLVVDVAGWVRRPGVYEFPSGARVIDAVDRAGGARPGADLTLLNLAAPLADGQQILVPQRGQASGPVGAVGTGGPAALINVNSADPTTLESLSGIGEVLAAAIVQYREEHGPFTSVDQLEDVPGIGPATLEDIRDQVTV